MNIVKGVADLLRRSSGGQTGDVTSWQQVERFSAPSQRIQFGEVGDEAVLYTLWKRHENTTDKVEKRKLLQIFIMHFLRVYKNWEPDVSSELQNIDEMHTGCSIGHPTEIILVLVQETVRLTASITELQSTPNLSEASVSLNIGSEGINVLDALTIVSRSVYNCKVFVYHGGMQKLTALMKAAVVQLKSLISVFAEDECMPFSILEKIAVLQKILVYIVTIICNVIDLNPKVHDKVSETYALDHFPSKENTSLDVQVISNKGINFELRREWQQKAITSVLEAGGLNWLVELLRVVKRLSLKEQLVDISVQHLTLKALRCSLSENSRAQNHFRSIGGLEVLLDGLSLPSSSTLALKNAFLANNERNAHPMNDVFQLQILSLEVLREAVFGNLNNMQFLCENGRIQKFANNLCWPAFMIQEVQRGIVESSVEGDNHMPLEEIGKVIQEVLSRSWNEYVLYLSRVLCSFLLALEDIEFHCIQASVGRTSRPVSFVYSELSIKWTLKMLRTVFPCIKACSTQNELPAHLRVLASTLQHYVLYTYRKVLVSSPILLEVFREEGVWDVIFSENFFYFGPTLNESSGESHRSLEDVSRNSGTLFDSHVGSSEVDILQMEIISFVEFAATLNGNTQNLQECSVLLETLEQSACNPGIASVLVRSLHRILQLSCEQTVVSFKTLDAIARVLNVSCIEAQELRSLSHEHKRTKDSVEPDVLDSIGSSEKWIQCMEDSFELFTEYLNTTDDAKLSVLHNPKCIDCLFDLFWDERLRKLVLEYILEFLKLPLYTEDDKTAKLQLCSKYLETFTRAKDMENGFAELSIDLLVGMRDVLLLDQMYYQDLFRDGECFLHIVSLLNGSLDKKTGEPLVLNVLQTLTCLLTGNDNSKAAFRALVGVGYQTLQSLLFDVCQWQPSMELLNSLLDMLVDGKFDDRRNLVIKNEDVIILFFNVLRKSSDVLQHYGLDVFLHLISDSISNQASCYRAGMLSFLLDWFSFEDNDDVVWKITQLIQVIGRHSISGTDIRKIFALLRSEKVGLRPKYCSLLLGSIQSMLKVKGPTAFFELSGIDSGILIKTPIQWPYNKGFSFSCWVRVESFPSSDLMGLFSLRTENGRGCSAVFGRDKLVVETVNQKRQCVSLSLNLIEKKWQFLCITHSIGRAFSGGSLLRCYVDGDLFSMEKCRYAKVSDTLTHCSIGSKIVPAPDEDSTLFPFKDSLCLRGQLGPIYMFADAISPEQVKGIFSFGPSYMYSFHDSDDSCNFDTSLSNGILDAKEGLASKIICGLNAQASNGRSLFNVAPLLDPTLDKNLFQAAVLSGTQLCSRRLLQHIIYCVGGVSVFFPLLTQFDRNEKSKTCQLEYTSLRSITRDRLATEVVELIASVLDENPANQQQMYLLSGFPILGFLLRSVPPPQLSLEAVSALKHLLNVVKKSGISELLVRDAILAIYLNPHIWVYADFNVQRELYMLLIQHFENDNKLLTSSCRLPQIIDIIRQFYWDKAIGRSAFGCKPLLHPATGEIIAERPNQDEIHKIRLLLLSLAEMSLRQNIEASDIKALVAFFERNQDMVCIEDILHMVIRFVSQKPLLAAFLEQVNSLGGCHIFLNLLSRELEPIRLLALQFIGKLLVGLPSEKKGPKLFNLGVARGKSISESHRKANTTYQPIVSAMSDRLFMFPHTDNLCATLFDVLLGGASPKQVLQMCSLPEKQRSKQLSPGSSSHFVLPQILILIFNILSSCDDTLARMKIWRDLLDLLDSNPSNAEAFMENAWSSWLSLLLRLDVFKNYKAKSLLQAESLERNEQSLARSLFCSVLTHYTCWVKGGWQQLEETVNSLLLICEQGSCSCKLLIRDIFEDLLESLVKLSSEYNIFLSQPCRDNTLFLLQSVDEMLINEQGHLLPFPGNCLSSDFSPEFFESENQKEVAASVFEALSKGFNEEDLRTVQVDMMDDWWTLYEKVWIVICELNDKGPSKSVTKTATQVGPSLGQRARGLVESLNIPAAEMAAVVVSGGIGSALSGKSHKYIDKAMLLRGEKCPRIVFRLVILYVCHAGLEQTSRCVQHFLSLLPGLLTADDEQNKNRLQLFIWSLLTVRSHCEMTDEGARFHVISHLIRETVHYGKSLLLTSIQGKEDLSNSGTNMKEAGMVHNLIQKERLLCAVEDEAKYVKALKTDRLVQIQDLRIRLEENSSGEIIQKKALEEEIQTNLSLILTADDKRRSAAQLAVDEYQQVVAAKWVHVFRTLVDERGPWSANAFPNSTVKHWKHDKTEDLWRRRPKLKRNYHFDEQLCHPPASTVSTAMDSAVDDGTASFKDYVPEKMKRFLLKGIRGITEDGSSEVYDMDTDVNGAKAENSLDQNTDLGQDADDQEASTTARAETDEVLLSVPCVLVTPKRKLAGHLAIMHNVLHFFGEFLVEGTGGSSVFNNFGNKAPTGSDSLTGAHKYRNPKVSISSDGDDIRANSLVNLDNLSGALKQGDKVKRHRRWNVLKIKAVHWTRYLLRYTSLEIFFNSSVAPVFFNFSSQQEAKDVGTLIVNTRNDALFPKGTARDRNAIISFVDRRVALEMAETARESWRRREMSNFEYLIILNTLAGRSYNDLTQYLIFPWILADYTSEKLDFNKSSTFRDLTKPVGALDFKRFEVFEDRYQNFSDPDIPSFYYGSHYSSMGIVLYYLLRLEPFTALHRHLQGGKFDHADRLFQSIESTYKNCLSNTSDVKELIPEFFYMPEFLVNSNSYHLGVKQDGEPLGDVTLPPWAKGSPEEFIHKNREALESEFVSSNLHHWIDLVFGYKQRGKPAVEAANVFYYLTYEGAVDLDTMDDELQSSAIEDQIANFGQTPIQIFRKKHPRRGPPIPIAHPLYFAPASISLTSVISNTTHQSAVLFVGVFDASVLLVNSGLTMSVKLWVTTQLQSGGNFTFSSSQEPFFGIGPDVLSPRRINTPMAENVQLGRQNFAIMQTPSENFLISCGNWENSFQIICLNDGKVVQSVRHHKDIVSCVAVSSDGSVLATGSYDTTIMLWEVSNVRTIERKVKNAPTDLPTKNRLILESPFHILCGHDDIITCLFVSVELDLVISGSRDGTCIFHSLRKGCYIRSIRHPSGSPLSKLVASQHGRIVFYSHNDLSFHLYSINGKHVASSESNGRLNCVELSSCGEFLVCAGDHGQIVVRSMHSLETVRRYDGIGKIITALTVTPEECFLAGTKDGTLLVYSIDNPQIKKGSVHRTKYKTSAVG